jgi:hypothetical protein
MVPLERGELAFAATEDHDLELAVVDLGVARAFWEGVPTARLLARVRIDRDEHDLVDVAERASGVDLASSTWDALMARLLGDSPAAFERVKRGVARHGRAASDEGPLVGSDAAIAALVHALLSASESESDASPAEGAADGLALAGGVMRACGRLDERLGATRADRRAAPFEACLHLAKLGSAGPVSIEALRALGPRAASSAPLYPWGDVDVPRVDRRALLLDRAAIEAAGGLGPELGHLRAHHGSLVAFVTLEPRSVHDGPVVPPSSWFPSDFTAPGAAARLAAGLERGATTAPRARAVILRGGDAALDAIGAEMLEARAHPFASAVFADTLGRASRERDVVRLVSYFAIANDAATAAHALAASAAPEVPVVLRAWLESLGPAEVGSPARARIEACVAALAPYPHLHDAVVSVLGAPASEPPRG